MCITIPVPDPGEGTAPPPLFLDQTEARRAEKYIFLQTGPPAFYKSLDDAPPPPPPHLKVWSRQCILSLKTPQMGVTLGVQAVNLILKLYNIMS